MKFSPRCRTKKVGIIYTILGSFYSFLNWEGTNIRLQIRPRKISVFVRLTYIDLVCLGDARHPGHDARGDQTEQGENHSTTSQ